MDATFLDDTFLAIAVIPPFFLVYHFAKIAFYLKSTSVTIGIFANSFINKIFLLTIL